MIFDKQSLFSDDQAVTDTADSTNSIDLGAARNIGAGNPVPIEIRVTESFATLTSVTVTLEEDDNSGFTSATTLASTGAIAVADLVAGYVFPLLFMPANAERYLQLVYTVIGTTATAGKILAGLTPDHQTNGANV